MKALRIILITLAFLATAFIGFRFFNTGKVLSPSATATFDKNGLQVNVDYCKPSKKDRLIFGEEKDKALVPFGKWWRSLLPSPCPRSRACPCRAATRRAA